MDEVGECLSLSRDQSPPEVSFEFFPPKTDRGEENLRKAAMEFATLRPRFMSVTYGAGGTTRTRTQRTVRWLQAESGVPIAGHLTCVNASREEVDDVARNYYQSGIRRIVALRGDPPGGEEKFRPHPEGYKSAIELVTGLKQIADFDISVAAYPEGHPDRRSEREELDYLKRKVDAGASRIITQFVFDTDVHLRFRDKLAREGIDHVPLVPGIMPITSFKGIKNFSAMCGATIPDWLEEAFDGLDEDPEQRKLVAASIAAEQCCRLRVEGFDNFHFYTLNKAELPVAVCRLLGRTPEPSAESDTESTSVA